MLLTGGPRGAVQGRAAVEPTAANLRAGEVGIRDWGGGAVGGPGIQPLACAVGNGSWRGRRMCNATQNIYIHWQWW